MKHIAIVFAALCAAGTCVTHAEAATILDQLPADVTSGSAADTSQFFGAPLTAENTAVIDNFSVGSGTTLTAVSAALVGFANFSTYSAVTSYSVEIYSSVAAAATNLTGNVASVTLNSSAVTLTQPYTFNEAALVDIPIDIDVAAGTYWVAVIPSLNFLSSGDAEIGIVEAAAGDADQVNPGGGFGFSGNVNPLGVGASYRIEGDIASVPEPATFTLLGLGLFGLALLRRGNGSSIR